MRRIGPVGEAQIHVNIYIMRIIGLSYILRRKTVSGNVYLYEIFDRGGNGTSLGRLDEENQTRFNEYHKRKAALKDRISQLRSALAESAALYRALRLPLLSSDAGPILRECDRRRLLGESLLVVGTNAMAAYMVEANGFIDLPDETEDFDLAWSGRHRAMQAMQSGPC